MENQLSGSTKHVQLFVDCSVTTKLDQRGPFDS